MPPPVSAKYEGTVRIGSSTIMINANGIVYPSNCLLSPSENNGVALIAEILRRLRCGKSLEVEMPRSIMIAVDKLVMCEWLDSGTLKVHADEPNRKWMHCDTEVEAIAAKRSFTCYESLSRTLPSKRTDTMREVALMQLGFVPKEKEERENEDVTKI